METVVTAISEQGKLTADIETAINNVSTLAELEDIYRPYKPKRKTRASIARERGLEPLANYLLAGIKEQNFTTFVTSFINEEKGVNTENEALNGAYDIIAEQISDNAVYRKFIKSEIQKDGFITTKEIAKDEKDTYAQYADYKEKVATIPPHRILAINRGEKVKCLRISLMFEMQPLETRIARDYLLNNAFAPQLDAVIKDALKRLILPSVETEIRNDLFTKAEDASLLIFKRNLQALLLYPPLKNKKVLGFDPAFRTGCKYAVVNEHGVPGAIGVVNLTMGSAAEVERARVEITKVIKDNKIDVIALGNGTASRESETELSAIIAKHKLPTKVFIVNESGASVYSASEVGENEFPTSTVEKRSAISIARRLQDPLSELVKINPKALGVGQYQHDMNQAKLSTALDGVVEDSVNMIGVNVNTSSVELLKYVAGVSKKVANNIVTYIQTKGPLKSRQQLKSIPQLGARTFEQCAGFLRIYDGQENLDATAIHPESYEVAHYLIKKANIDVLIDDTATKEAALSLIDVAEVKTKFNIGSATLTDIIAEIKRPGRDIREDVEIVHLNNDVKDIKHLKVGMILNGTVRNIMDFGMFVDINVHQDGLVHISEISNTYIRDISMHYAINDVVKVKVISVDVSKKRIGLSLKQVN